VPDTGEDARWTRQAANERLVREFNYEKDLVDGADGRPDEEVLFYCACGREDCDRRLCLSIAEYRAAHAAPHRFIVDLDHVTPHIERVVERHPKYLVVEKLPAYQGADPTAG
jgi:hypothetical protein